MGARVNSFEEQFACLFLLGEAEISLLGATCSKIVKRAVLGTFNLLKTSKIGITEQPY